MALSLCLLWGFASKQKEQFNVTLKIKLTICKHQVDSPLYLWLYVCTGDPPANNKEWFNMTLIVLKQHKLNATQLAEQLFELYHCITFSQVACMCTYSQICMVTPNEYKHCYPKAFLSAAYLRNGMLTCITHTQTFMEIRRMYSEHCCHEKLWMCYLDL